MSSWYLLWSIVSMCQSRDSISSTTLESLFDCTSYPLGTGASSHVTGIGLAKGWTHGEGRCWSTSKKISSWFKVQLCWLHFSEFENTWVLSDPPPLALLFTVDSDSLVRLTLHEKVVSLLYKEGWFEWSCVGWIWARGNISVEVSLELECSSIWSRICCFGFSLFLMLMSLSWVRLGPNWFCWWKVTSLICEFESDCSSMPMQLDSSLPFPVTVPIKLLQGERHRIRSSNSCNRLLRLSYAFDPSVISDFSSDTSGSQE